MVMTTSIKFRQRQPAGEEMRQLPHRTARGPKGGARDWLALGLLMFPVLLVAVDNTALTFALPAIARSLDPSGVQLLWIVDAYGSSLQDCWWRWEAWATG